MKKDKLPEIELVSSVIKSSDEFKLAVEQAQTEGVDSLEVTDELFQKLFRHIYKENSQLSVTYGSPGIRVYREGTRDRADKIDSMSAEALGTHQARERMMS